jgi:DNA-directed RNA polymerase subunit RPC12/RpoP
MAKPRFNDPIEPMDLANMRQYGMRSLDVQCNQCRHRVIVNVDHLPGDLTLPSFGAKMVCTRCGKKSVVFD